ncbi:hypothetical protein BDR05DRAFT_388182 [Suillus weaverae]|nr:hypothetical protein BDR05DRAFT_388182 [Suillus weaverae]
MSVLTSLLASVVLYLKEKYVFARFVNNSRFQQQKVSKVDFHIERYRHILHWTATGDRPDVSWTPFRSPSIG